MFWKLKSLIKKKKLDNDSSKNSGGIFFIEWEYQKLFSVSPLIYNRKSKANLYLKKALDYESKKKYTFKV